MPYISEWDRKHYSGGLGTLIYQLKQVPEEDRDGHVNYVVTVLLKALYEPAKYKRYNRAMGVLECIKQEFYRRMVAPYEDKKIAENGDV